MEWGTVSTRYVQDLVIDILKIYHLSKVTTFQLGILTDVSFIYNSNGFSTQVELGSVWVSGLAPGYANSGLKVLWGSCNLQIRWGFLIKHLFTH